MTADVTSFLPRPDRAEAVEHLSEDDRLAAATFEAKFVAERWRAESARRWLQMVCRPDPDFPEATVYTVYYDTPGLRCLHEKLNGDYLKSKVRLRWYRVGERAGDAAFLEVKMRLGSRREKVRVPVPFQGTWPTYGSLDVPSLRSVPRQLRVAGITIPHDYRPVLLVRYRRHRFIERLTGLRASLDTDICSPAVSRREGLTPRDLPLPFVVFEWKGLRDTLPDSLRILTTLGFRKSSFSKYSACYDYTLTAGG